MEPDVHDVCNLSGLCCIMMSKMWQCANFKFLSQNGPMGMGQRLKSVLRVLIYYKMSHLLCKNRCYVCVTCVLRVVTCRKKFWCLCFGAV